LKNENEEELSSLITTMESLNLI